MRKFMGLLSLKIAGIKLVLSGIAVFSVSVIYSQNNQLVTGKFIDKKSNQAVPYANVTMIKDADSAMFRGTIADGNGVFKISPVPVGKYKLLATTIGYKSTTISLDVVTNNVTDVGIIFLQDTAIFLEEAVVMSDRLKAKSEKGKTTFYITKKMLDASNSGTDVLKLIPGIQVDIMQNVSLQGSQNIMIFVDGKERDRSYLSQLNPKQIEKVEVISTPPSNYDGNATGGINIILKKDRDSGFTGQIYAEIPTSASKAYVFPTYSLNYGFKKLNFYTSYNGEILYFDVHESIYRKIPGNSGETVITSDQYVKQRDWSHKFHYGFDYFMSSHDQFNFYAFYNPYSSEHNGTADARISGSINKPWQAKREDMNMNVSTFYSMYYKHLFDKEGREITLDLNNYNLKGENRSNFIYVGAENKSDTLHNNTKPSQNTISLKFDFTTPLGDKLSFSTGAKARFQVLQDRHLNDFDYDEKIVAAYGTVTYKNTKYDLNMGLRAERSVSTLKNSFSNPILSVLPYTTFRYSLTSGQNIQFSFNRTVNRPYLNQLNPSILISDPFTVYRGNPSLKPELRSSLFIEHSIQFRSNFFSSRLFYNKSVDAINNLMFINDTSAFETQMQNLGTIHQFGVQFLGSLKLGIATVNPYLRLFDTYTVGNHLAKQYGVENRLNPDFESGLSTILSFKNDLALSFVFQYASPRNNIQGNSFCDVLYFISLEKTWKQKIKIGIVDGFPFTRSFVYQGSDITGQDFSSHYRGNINMSKALIWFKLGYQFSSGKKRDRISHANEEIDNLPKKGF